MLPRFLCGSPIGDEAFDRWPGDDEGVEVACFGGALAGVADEVEVVRDALDAIGVRGADQPQDVGCALFAAVFLSDECRHEKQRLRPATRERERAGSDDAISCGERRRVLPHSCTRTPASWRRSGVAFLERRTTSA